MIPNSGEVRASDVKSYALEGLICLTTLLYSHLETIYSNNSDSGLPVSNLLQHTFHRVSSLILNNRKLLRSPLSTKRASTKLVSYVKEGSFGIPRSLPHGPTLHPSSSRWKKRTKISILRVVLNLAHFRKLHHDRLNNNKQTKQPNPQNTKPNT